MLPIMDPIDPAIRSDDTRRRQMELGNHGTILRILRAHLTTIEFPHRLSGAGTFSHLPLDVVEQVIEFLDLGSTSRLPQASKGFRQLLEPRMYKTIDLGCAVKSCRVGHGCLGQEECTNNNPASEHPPVACLLYTLIVRPDLAATVEDFSYTGLAMPELVPHFPQVEHDPWTPEAGWSKTTAWTPKNSDLHIFLEEWLGVWQSFNNYDLRPSFPWTEDFDDGDVGLLLALVLERLPNLKRLRISGGWHLWKGYVFRVLRYNAALSRSRGNTFHALQRLKVGTYEEHSR